MKVLKEQIEDQNMEFQKKNKVSVLSELIAATQKAGKKERVEGGLLNMLRSMKREYPKFNIVGFLNDSVSNVKPYVGFISKKVGSVTYKIPIGLRFQKEISLGVYWIVDESCGRKLGPYATCLKKELINAFKKRGLAYKRKEVVHDVAENTRVYLKYLR